jgi:O-6-methylguanine DNA methyltransferase
MKPIVTKSLQVRPSASEKFREKNAGVKFAVGESLLSSAKRLRFAIGPAGGTAFQLRVWQAVRVIPVVRALSYAEVAQRIGKCSAARAVAQLCAENAIAIAILCHRVARGDGVFSGYRWGLDRKRAVLGREASA